MNKKSVYGIGIAKVIVLLCLVYVGNRSTSTQDVTVCISYLNIVASLPIFIAEAQGFLKEEGLPYETTAIATSNQLVDAVVAGRPRLLHRIFCSSSST